MIDMSMQIGGLYLKNPVFLAAGPLTTKLENLIKAEKLGLGAVDTKVTLTRRYPKIKFKLQPIAGLFADIPQMATVMEQVGLSAIQISDGVGGYPSLAIDAPPYHPFNCLDFQARDGFISGPYLKPLVYKTVYEYSNQTNLPIICSGGIWDSQSAIEAILYGSSVIASASGPCIKGWEMFTDIIQGIENYMQHNHYSQIGDFKGLAGQYIKDNKQIDYPDCYAVVDESQCTGCEQCLPPAHCNAIVMHKSLARINKEGCVGCCICKYLCPENAIDMKLSQ